MTNNVRSDTDTFRFLVMMEAWRNVLLNVSREELLTWVKEE